MFSKDSNIETIAQLVEESKKYISLQGEYLRLSAVEKIVRLATAIAVTFVLTVLLLLTLTYFSLALAFALGSLFGNVCGFLVVGSAYAVLLVVFFLFRKAWVERPLVRFLVNLLDD